MSIQLRPHSTAEPIELDDVAYQRLVRRQEGGWSNAVDLTEWLAKLHYLRAGHREGKLDAAQFAEREDRLVAGYVRRVMEGQASVGVLIPGAPPAGGPSQTPPGRR